jgi:hypothetical protein
VNFKISRADRNSNHGFVRRTSGDLRRIVGPKVVFPQISCGCAHNHMVITKVISEERLREKGANAISETSLKREGGHRHHKTCNSGCVTNWYQSMVTTLGLLGLMYESCKEVSLSAFTP